MAKKNFIGSITKLKGNRSKKYWVRTPPVEVAPNEFKQISLGTFQTLREAKEALQNWKELCKKKSEKKYTLKEAFDLSIKELYEIGKTSERTLESYENDFKRLEPLWGKDVKTISTSDYQDIFNNLINKKTGEVLGQSTKQRTKVVLQIVYWYLLKEEIVSFDASQGIIVFSQKKPQTRDSFTNSDIEKLWQNVFKIDYVDSILLMTYTGMRPSEMIQCTIFNTSIEKRKIEGVGVKTEKGKNRIIPIPKKLLPVVKKMINSANKNGYLLKTVTGEKMSVDNYGKKYFKEALEKCDINSNKFVPYSCRHTYAELLRINNIDNKTQADLMGHEKESTTKLYQPARLDIMLDAVDSI